MIPYLAPSGFVFCGPKRVLIRSAETRVPAQDEKPALTAERFSQLEANPEVLAQLIDRQQAEANAYAIEGLVEQIKIHHKNLTDHESVEAEYGALTPQHVKRAIERETSAIVEKSARLKELLEQVYQGRRQRWRMPRGCSSATATTRTSMPDVSSSWPTTCREGIDVILDQYVHPAPEEGWPRWMDRNIDEAQFALMVCTETYRRRVMGQEEPGKGLGVRWEGSLIYNRIYHDKPSGSRFIPILLPGSEPAHIPNPVQGHAYYRIATFDLTDPGFEALYRHLTDQPATLKPGLGELIILPPKPRLRPSPDPLSPSGGPTTNVGGHVIRSAVGAGNTVNARIGHSTLRVDYCDITTLNVDVMVSSDDIDLSMGGGVSQALLRAGGEPVRREAQSQAPIPLGDIAVTTAGRLRAKRIFHAAVLDYARRELTTIDLIRRVTNRCLELCDEMGFQSIAFPALAIGAARFSPERSAVAMLIETASHLTSKTTLRTVILALYPRPGLPSDILPRFYSQVQEAP